jgi:hypothetical protein
MELTYAWIERQVELKLGAASAAVATR